MSINLHLGCGKRYLPGYVHIDYTNYPHVNYVHDISRLPMISDESVDIIYASHVLEYFDKVQVREVLKEWKYKLKPGGILRLAVPDFDALVQVYTKSTDGIDLISGPIFGRWKATDSTEIWHKEVYNFEKLYGLLTIIGFQKIERWDWRNVFVGTLRGYDDYSQAYIPHLDKENGTLISLNVQGVRA